MKKIKKMSFFTRVLVLAVFSLPLVTTAAVPRFDTLVDNYIGGMRMAGTMFLGIGVFFIIVGIFRYLGAGDDPVRRAEGNRLLMWGIITAFVIVSFWGFVNIVTKTFFNPADINSFTRDNRLW